MRQGAGQAVLAPPPHQQQRPHAIVHLDRDIDWLDDRRAHPWPLGRRSALLLVSTAEWCRRRRGTVDRIQAIAVRMIGVGKERGALILKDLILLARPTGIEPVFPP